MGQLGVIPRRAPGDSPWTSVSVAIMASNSVVKVSSPAVGTTLRSHMLLCFTLINPWMIEVAQKDYCTVTALRECSTVTALRECWRKLPRPPDLVQRSKLCVRKEERWQR